MIFRNGPEESVDCSLCLGAGFVKLNIPQSDSRFGKAQVCLCRDSAFKEKRARYLNEICRIPSGNRYDELDMFLDNHANIVRTAIRHSSDQRKFIAVYGGYGTGKTTLLCAAVNEVISSGLVGMYVTMADLFEHLRKAYRPEAKIDQDKFWDTLIAADMLALDEVDRWKATPWAQEKFFALIDQRYRSDKGTTIIATNKSIKRGVGILEDEPGYFESRLLAEGNTIIKMTGPDRRTRMQERMI